MHPGYSETRLAGGRRHTRNGAAAILPILTTLVFAACDAGGPTRLAGPGPVAPPTSGATELLATTQTLWDQSVTGGVATFANTPTPYADDFVVPAGTTWTITELMMVLSLRDKDMPPTIAIRADNNGQPGAVLATPTLSIIDFTLIPDGQGFYWGARYRLAPAAPIALGPGTYWLTLDMGGNVANWWVTSGPGNPYHFSLDGGQTWFGTSLGPNNNDLGFSLTGTAETATTKTTDLLTTLGGLGLDAGIHNSLAVKLKAALAALEAGDTAAACSALNAFVNQVNALSGKKFSSADAAMLLAEAASLRALLGC